MKTVSANLSTTEVRAELLRVAADASIFHTIFCKLKALGSTKEEVLAQPPSAVRPTLALIASNIKAFTRTTLLETKAGSYLNWLKQHPDDPVRHHATQLFTTMRSDWMSSRAAKRARQE